VHIGYLHNSVMCIAGLRPTYVCSMYFSPLMCMKSFCGHPEYVYSVTRYNGHCADCLASHSGCQIMISRCTMPSVVHALFCCSTFTALIALLSYKVEWVRAARQLVAVIKFQPYAACSLQLMTWSTAAALLA